MARKVEGETDTTKGHILLLSRCKSQLQCTLLLKITKTELVQPDERRHFCLCLTFFNCVQHLPRGENFYMPLTSIMNIFI